MDIARFQQLIQEAELDQLIAMDSAMRRAPALSKGKPYNIITSEDLDGVVGLHFRPFVYYRRQAENIRLMANDLRSSFSGNRMLMQDNSGFKCTIHCCQRLACFTV